MLFDIVNKKKEEIQSIENITEATYEVISSDETNLKILILIKNQEGIKTIQFPNGDILYCNNRKTVGIDYEVEKNKQYNFIIETKEKEKFILDAKDEDPIVLNGENGGYAIIDKYGIKDPQIGITLQNSLGKSYYYSLDDGNTWIRYEDEVKLKETKTIKVKEKTEDNKIIQLISKEVKVELALNAIGKEAHQEGKQFGMWNNSYYMYISSEAIGRNLCWTCAPTSLRYGMKVTAEFLNENKETIEFTNENGVQVNNLQDVYGNSHKINIPTRC